MSKIAIAAVLTSTLLAVFTNRWVTDPPSPGFVMADLRWIGLLIQWIGFLLALAAMAIFFGQWRVSGKWPRPAYLGAALLAFYAVEGVPFTWDSAQWKTSNRIGAWRRKRTEQKEEAAALERLAGNWKSPTASYEFRSDSFTIRRGGAADEAVSNAACDFGFTLRYRMGGRYVLPGTEESVKYTEGLDSSLDLAALEATCGNAQYAFMLRPNGTVVAYRMTALGEVSYEVLSR